MTVSNDFLPFATDGGANVLSQSAYAALAAVGAGFLSGIARSDEVNKVLRQATFGTAALGELINSQAGVDAADDGDVGAFADNLLTAISVITLKSSYVTTTNSGNAYSGTIAGQFDLTNKLWLLARFATVNSADGPTLNLNGLGAKTIYLKDFTTVLPKGQLPIEALLSFHNDLDGWVMLTEPTAGGYAVDSNTSANAITVQIPGIRAYFDGLRIDFKCKTTNTNTTTINVTALGSKALKYQGANLTAGQLVAGRIYRVAYNSVADEFQLISPPG